jgi:polyadenylation factor subunit 2
MEFPPPELSMPPPSFQPPQQQSYQPSNFQSNFPPSNYQPRPFNPNFHHHKPYYKSYKHQQVQDDFDGKRLRKSVMRKTVDYNSSIVKALEVPFQNIQ